MNMEEKDLIKLVAPTYKQYIKSLFMCFFIYVIFKINNGLVIAISVAMIINLLSSMIEASRWTSDILNNNYDLVYAKVTGYLYSAIVTDISDDYALPLIKDVNVGDEVMLLVFKNEYLVIKKISLA